MAIRHKSARSGSERPASLQLSVDDKTFNYETRLDEASGRAYTPVPLTDLELLGRGTHVEFDDQGQQYVLKPGQIGTIRALIARLARE